jgi:hypothetical protein
VFPLRFSAMQREAEMCGHPERSADTVTRSADAEWGFHNHSGEIQCDCNSLGRSPRQANQQIGTERNEHDVTKSNR